MDSSCYLFPELSRAKTGRALRDPTARCGFQRTAVSPAPTSHAGAPSPLRRPDALPAGLEEIEQQAYCCGFDDGARSGYDQGEKAGNEAAIQRLTQALETCRRLAAELDGLRRKASADLETEIVQLTLAIARKIVCREPLIAPETVAGVVRQALARVEHAGRITIRLHPEDLKILAELSPAVTAGRPDADCTQFEADPGITRGGCLILTDSGEVDARLEHQLQVVEEAFRAERDPGGGSRSSGP